MPSKEEKDRRRVIAREKKQSAAKSAVAKLPLTTELMQALFDCVDGKLSEGCDHTLTFTTEFLSLKNLPQASVLAWMKEHGGYCDCEVIANVEEYFHEILQSSQS